MQTRTINLEKLTSKKRPKITTPAAVRAAMAVVMAAAVAGDLLWAVRALTAGDGCREVGGDWLAGGL